MADGKDPLPTTRMGHQSTELQPTGGMRIMAGQGFLFVDLMAASSEARVESGKHHFFAGASVFPQCYVLLLLGVRHKPSIVENTDLWEFRLSTTISYLARVRNDQLA